MRLRLRRIFPIRQTYPSWQDLSIGIGNLVLSQALIPMIFASSPPPLSSTLITATVLWIFVVTWWSLRLKFSVATTALGAAMWTTLAVQGFIN